MNAAEILSELEARDVEVAVLGDRLRFRPAQAVPEDLREELRVHKPELLAMLRTRQVRTIKDALAGGVSRSERSLLAAEILALPIDDFAQAGLVVTVLAQVLDEAVVFASDDAVVDPGERRVVYRAAELRTLLGLEPEEVRSLHKVKKTFGGTIVPS